MANDHAQPLFHPGLEKSFTEAAAGDRALDGASPRENQGAPDWNPFSNSPGSGKGAEGVPIGAP